MYQGKRVAVVVPAYNEERLIGKVIETMPDFVDRIIVVDDASHDDTARVVEGCQQTPDCRVDLVRHPANQGVGGAILSGHKRALEAEADVIAVMAGDAQMDPADLPAILDPVVEGRADYSKGNRFIRGEAWRNMPRLRYFANAGLSMLNKIAIGYWHVADPQCGYTAISRPALQLIQGAEIRRGYHFENSMLLTLNIYGLRVIDVPIYAIYGIGEKSGINHLWALVSSSSSWCSASFTG